MGWSEDDKLRSGASNSEEYEAVFGSGYDGGISPRQVSRIADEIMADKSAPSTTPLEGRSSRNRHLDGYANPRKWD